MSGGHKHAISKADREKILDLVLNKQFEESMRLAKSLGLREDYPNFLANSRGFHIRDLTGNRGVKGKPVFPVYKT